MNNKQQQILVSFKTKPLNGECLEHKKSKGIGNMKTRRISGQGIENTHEIDFKRKQTSKYSQIDQQHSNRINAFKKRKMKAREVKQDSFLSQKLSLLVDNPRSQPSLVRITRQDIDKLLKNYQESIKCIFVNSSIFTQNIPHGTFFIDKKFSPFLSSLYGCKNCHHRIKQWKNIIWQKISSIWPVSPLFYEEGKVQDLIRGNLGDRYFLIGVIALANKNIANISSLFVSVETKTENCYFVRILQKGKWSILVLDDYVPCVDDNPAFNYTQNHELWLILLQKAWAKLYGSYSHIESGFIQEPLHDLTGAPVSILFLKKKQASQIWSYLSSKEAEQYVIVANSQESKVNELQSANGILYDFSYFLLGVYEIKQKNEHLHHKIVKLKCESEKYRGRWSDYDPIWVSIPSEEKQRVGYKRNMDDGVFFMDFEEFLYDFNHIISAEIVQDASYISQTCIDRQLEGCYFKLQIYSSGSYSLQIDKTPERKYVCNASKINYKYPKSYLQIYQFDNNTQQLTCIGDSHSSSKRRSLFHRVVLNPGIYFVYARTTFDIKTEDDYEITLAVYSQKPASLKETSQLEKIMLKNLSSKLQEMQIINNQTTKQQNPEHNFENKIVSLPQFTKKNSSQAINFLSSISTDSPLYTSKTSSFIKNQNQSNKSSFIKKNQKSNLSNGEIGENILDEYGEQEKYENGDAALEISGEAEQLSKCENIEIDLKSEENFSDSSFSSSSIIYHFDDEPQWIQQYGRSPLEKIDQQSSIILYTNRFNEDPSTIYEVSSSRQQSSIARDPLPLAPTTSFNSQYHQTFNKNFCNNQQLQQSFYIYLKDQQDQSLKKQ